MLLAVSFALSLSPQVVAACPRTYVQVKNAAAPDFPEGITFIGPRETLVTVRVSATGVVLGTSIHESSGDKALDRAAVAATRASTYQPAMINCKAVADTFLFKVKFESNP